MDEEDTYEEEYLEQPGPGDLVLPTTTKAAQQTLLASGWRRYGQTAKFYWPANKLPRG